MSIAPLFVNKNISNMGMCFLSLNKRKILVPKLSLLNLFLFHSFTSDTSMFVIHKTIR